MRGFREAVDELDARPVPDEVRKRVVGWYETDYMPRVRRAARRQDADRRVPAGRLGAVFPAGLVHRRQSLPQGSAQAGRRTCRRRYLQQAARDLPSADAHGGVDAELRRLPAGRPSQQPHHLFGREGNRVRHLAARRALPDFQPRRRRRALRPGAGSLGDLPRGFRRLPAVQRLAAGLHGGAGDRPGRRDRRAGGPALDRRARHHRHQQPALAPRGPGCHRRGLPGRSRLPGPLQPAHVLRESRPLFRGAEGRPDPGARHRGHPPLRHAGAAAARRHHGEPRRPGRRRGHRRDPGLSRHSHAGLVGAGAGVGRQMGADRQDRFLGGLRAGQAARARPHHRGRPGAAGGDRDRRLAVALAARALARAHRRRPPLRRWRPRRPRPGAHARRDRPALPRLQRHGRRDQREERGHRGQEPRERGAAAERPAGADRQPPARRREGHRRRLRRGHGGLRRHRRLHRRCRRTCRRPRSSPC